MKKEFDIFGHKEPLKMKFDLKFNKTNTDPSEVEKEPWKFNLNLQNLNLTSFTT